jgi:probable phosphoglycerate mutase
MKELFLIKHGEAEHRLRGMTGGWTDCKLTELGKKQALTTGQKLEAALKNKNFQMYSSDLIRASKTAEIIGKILNSPVLINSDLRSMNFGVATNKTIKEAASLRLPMTEPLWDWIPFPGGESWRMMKNRVYSFMNAINND